MESDTFDGEFVVKSLWRLPGNSVDQFFMNTRNNFQTNFTIKSPYTVSLQFLS